MRSGLVYTGRVRFDVSRRRSGATSPLGWRWGKVSHLGELGELRATFTEVSGLLHTVRVTPDVPAQQDTSRSVLHLDSAGREFVWNMGLSYICAPTTPFSTFYVERKWDSHRVRHRGRATHAASYLGRRCICDPRPPPPARDPPQVCAQLHCADLLRNKTGGGEPMSFISGVPSGGACAVRTGRRDAACFVSASRGRKRGAPDVVTRSGTCSDANTTGPR